MNHQIQKTKNKSSITNWSR